MQQYNLKTHDATHRSCEEILTKLQDLKIKLNSCKGEIDAVNNKNYAKITDLIRLHDNLRGRNGIVKKMYNAEIVTNAWLKMWELSEFIFINPEFSSFHLAEAPGNFILALHHRIKTEYPKTKWTWKANSYILPGKTYIYDNYGLMKKYPKNWDYGFDNTGDITSIVNLRTWNEQENYDLITSDVKFVPENIDFDEEERNNIQVHTAHVIAALCMTKPGGRFILKHLTLFEKHSMVLLQILHEYSRKLILIKPETSRPANSEVYIVGILHEQPSIEFKNTLFSLLESGVAYGKFVENFELNPDFINNIYKIQKNLVRLQCQEINRNLSFFHKYKNHNYAEIRYMMNSQRENTAREWIKKYKIRYLNNKFKLL